MQWSSPQEATWTRLQWLQCNHAKFTQSFLRSDGLEGGVLVIGDVLVVGGVLEVDIVEVSCFPHTEFSPRTRRSNMFIKLLHAVST